MKTLAHALNPAQLDRRLWWVLAAYCLLLVVGTHMPVPAPEAAPPGVDKPVHLLIYAPLACLLAVCVTPRGGRLAVSTGLLVWTVVVVFGAVDELTQPFFGRTADVRDWLSDALGAALGVVAYGVWSRLR